MALREAAIRLTLRSGAFQAGMRRLGGQVAAAGRKMGASLRAPMTAGLNAAKKSLAGMGSQLKTSLKTAATFGGAMSMGLLIKDAIKMQHMYRNIAFNIEKVPGNVMDWHAVQELVDKEVIRTGQSAEKLAMAFHEVWKATGDLEFTKKSLGAIGTVATASGEDILHIANAAQLMSRKFGVSADEVEEGLSRFIEKTGVGGKGIDELTRRFAMAAAEFAGAGKVGVEGISELLGLMIRLDSTVGEQVDPGLKLIFQTIKDGSAQFVALQKKARIKFDADMTALDKIKKTLTTARGRAAAEQVFTAEARVVYDELAKPFDKAMEEAKARGIKHSEAVKLAMAAFDDAIAKSSRNTLEFGTLQKEASERMREDPTVQMRMAIEKMRLAFTSPEMIKAIESLTRTLPPLAAKFAEFLEWITKNPWKAAGAAAGLKVAAPAAAAAAGTAAAAGAKGIAAKVAGGAVAAGTAATPTLAGAGKVGAVAAGGLTAGAAAAAGAAGGAVGFAGFKAIVEPAIEARLAGLRSIDEMLLTADELARTREISPEGLKGMIATLRAAQEEKAPTGFASFMAGTAKMLGADIKSAEEQHASRLLKLGEAESKLQTKFELMERQAGRAASALKAMSDAVPPPGTGRGIKAPANSAPGAAPVEG